MSCIREELLALFNIGPSEWARYVADGAADVNETGDAYHIHIELRPELIPEEEAIRAFLKEIKEWDTYEFLLENLILAETDGSFLRICDEPDENKYHKFITLFTPGDDIRVSLDIRKAVSQDRICSVYEWDAFSKCLLRTPWKRSPGFMPEYFNNLFEKYPEGINFYVLDKEVNFATASISFVHNADNLVTFRNRKEALKQYNEASLYMGRTENLLLPGDFHANEARCALPESHGQEMMDLFGRYETVYSLLYLAAASWFENKDLVIELKKGGKQYRLPVEKIKRNPEIYALADWVFAGESSIERAEITRDILAMHCLSAEDILSIGSEIKESASSSYSLYTKKVVDQYISIKKDVIKSIFESTKQVQELYGTLSDNLGKNFIAVITVVISQVLAHNIDWQKVGTPEFVNEEFRTVVLIYCIASLIYLIATLHTIYTKWKFYEDRYDKIREQYRYLLDEDELNKAFDNDSLIKKAQTRIFWYACAIAILWICMLAYIFMIAFNAKVWMHIFAGVVFAAGLIWSYRKYRNGAKNPGRL